MEYRGVKYKIRQGVERNVWKWSVSFEDGLTKSGQAVSRRRAITIVWHLIDEVLTFKKKSLATIDIDNRATEKRPAEQFLVQREIEELLRDLAAFNERIAELDMAGHKSHAMKVLKIKAIDFASQIDELRSLLVEAAKAKKQGK
jgi:hypothetical protein